MTTSPPAKRKPGRPTIRTEQMTQEILDRLNAGESLVSICKDEHMPARCVIYTWCDKDKTFSDRYARARRNGRVARVDAIWEMVSEVQERAKRGEATREEVANMRTMVMHAQWEASRLAKELYGDRVTVEGKTEQVVRFEVPDKIQSIEDWEARTRDITPESESRH